MACVCVLRKPTTGGRRRAAPPSTAPNAHAEGPRRPAEAGPWGAAEGPVAQLFSWARIWGLGWVRRRPSPFPPPPPQVGGNRIPAWVADLPTNPRSAGTRISHGPLRWWSLPTYFFCVVWRLLRRVLCCVVLCRVSCCVLWCVVLCCVVSFGTLQRRGEKQTKFRQTKIAHDAPAALR